MPRGSDPDIARQLLADTFQRSGPDAGALSDPIADTPMVVTLEQLRPYELNPRVTVNPLYAEIKASIRERGLDTAPAITRRPGESHYIIRNSGNTRLAILRELWAETKDERFFRIPCLFRPGPRKAACAAKSSPSPAISQKTSCMEPSRSSSGRSASRRHGSCTSRKAAASR